MSQISEYAGKMNAFLDRKDKAIDGVSGDITAAKELIVKLQSTQGQLTPEDEALLGQIQTRVEGAVTKLEALDALTPPATPTEPPTPPTV